MNKKNLVDSKRKLFSIFMVLLCVIFIVSVLSSCKDSPSPPEQKLSSKWVLNDSASSNLTQFDPIQIVDVTTINTLMSCYEGLVGFTSDGKIVPGIAERWEISQDKLHWRFFLKKDVKFHPFTIKGKSIKSKKLKAQDVVYSLKRATTHPKSFNTWWLGDIVARNEKNGPKIIAIDESTVQIELKTPYNLLNRLTSVAGWIYPENIDQELGDNKFATQVVGTGPYRLMKFIPDDKIVLQRWKNYHGSTSPNPPDQVVIQIKSDPLASIESFKANQIDVIELTLDTLAAGNELVNTKKALKQIVSAHHLDYLCFNLSSPPFDSLNLRKAMNIAIDRTKIKNVLKDMATPAFGFTPPVSLAYQGIEQLHESGFGYDPEAAKKNYNYFLDVCKQKGISKPESLKLYYDDDSLSELVMQIVKSHIEDTLPLKIELNKITWPELLEGAFTGKLPFHRLWWLIATPAEDVYFQFYMPGKNPPIGLNMSRYDDKTYAQNYLNTFSTESQNQQIISNIIALENHLIKNAVAIPLYHRKFVYIYRPSIDLIIGTTLRKYYHLAQKNEEVH